METVLLVVHLLVAIFLVSVILMQRSSGGALGGFGRRQRCQQHFERPRHRQLSDQTDGHSGDNIFYHQPFAVAAVQERRT